MLHTSSTSPASPLAGAPLATTGDGPPRPFFRGVAHAMCDLVTSPVPPRRTAYTSPARPFTTHTVPFPGTAGVGSPRPLKLLHDHNCLPVAGSYPATYGSPFSTN